MRNQMTRTVAMAAWTRSSFGRVPPCGVARPRTIVGVLDATPPLRRHL